MAHAMLEGLVEQFSVHEADLAEAGITSLHEFYTRGDSDWREMMIEQGQKARQMKSRQGTGV